MNIRLAEDHDHDDIWQIFHAIVDACDTYVYEPGTTREDALRVWLEDPRATLLCELDVAVVGTYYLKPNQPGLGDHVCNAGYMVAHEARGKGVGREMCEQSIAEARRLGYRAMQYNLVVATNPAVGLWERMGFDIVGRLPKAFRHSQLGFVDALVMYRLL